MRQRKMMNQINVVPYIDVMLVLLVIFMVTAPMANPGLIELPSVGKSSQAPLAPLEVVIKADQSMLLRESNPNAQVSERGITMAQLVQVLQQRQQKTPEQPVVIAADKDVRYEAVLKVMDELQRAQIQRVGLLVKPAQR
jgi:biopolymer transport protein TolR